MNRQREDLMDLDGVPLDQWETLIRHWPDESAIIPTWSESLAPKNTPVYTYALYEYKCFQEYVQRRGDIAAGAYLWSDRNVHGM